MLRLHRPLSCANTPSPLRNFGTVHRAPGRHPGSAWAKLINASCRGHRTHLLTNHRKTCTPELIQVNTRNTLIPTASGLRQIYGFVNSGLLSTMLTLKWFSGVDGSRWNIPTFTELQKCFHLLTHCIMQWWHLLLSGPVTMVMAFLPKWLESCLFLTWCSKIKSILSEKDLTKIGLLIYLIHTQYMTAGVSFDWVDC